MNGHYLIRPSPGLLPLGTRAESKTPDPPGRAELLEDAPDEVDSDSRTLSLDVANAERLRCPLNGRQDQFRLRPAGRFDLPEAVLELAAG